MPINDTLNGSKRWRVIKKIILIFKLHHSKEFSDHVIEFLNHSVFKTCSKIKSCMMPITDRSMVTYCLNAKSIENFLTSNRSQSSTYLKARSLSLLHNLQMYTEKARTNKNLNNRRIL